MNPCPCPTCGRVVDPGNTYGPGDIAICAGCASPIRFAEDGVSVPDLSELDEATRKIVVESIAQVRKVTAQQSILPRLGQVEMQVTRIWGALQQMAPRVTGEKIAELERTLDKFKNRIDELEAFVKEVADDDEFAKERPIGDMHGDAWRLLHGGAPPEKVCTFCGAPMRGVYCSRPCKADVEDYKAEQRLSARKDGDE